MHRVSASERTNASGGTPGRRRATPNRRCSRRHRGGLQLRTPSPAADHQRREADRLAIVPKLVEALELLVGDKTACAEARRELVGEEFPLRQSSLSIGPYLDGLCLGV